MAQYRESHPEVPLRVGIRCDASESVGVGHLIRQLALAATLMDRGHWVVLLGDIEAVPWGLNQALAVGLSPQPADPDPRGFVEQAQGLELDVVVVDGYLFPTALGRALRAAGIAVVTMVDGDFGLHQEADLYIDQNLGARAVGTLPPDAHMLAGLDHVLLRDQVRARFESPREGSYPPRTLVVFGGTDAAGGCPVLVRAAVDASVPAEIVAIAARPELRAELEQIHPEIGSSLVILEPVDDLAGLAITCDVAISAAGSSLWEFLYLGVPTALVAVTDNQLVGYERAVSEGLCVGLGSLEEIRQGGAGRELATAGLRRLLSDASLRLALSERGRNLVDGEGRERVAAAIEVLAAARRT